MDKNIFEELKQVGSQNLTKKDIEEAKKGLRAYKDLGEKLTDYFNDIEELYDYKQGKCVGLTTGIEAIDKGIGVLKNKELMVLGGAASAGKSLIATNIMAKLIQESKNVIYVSLEMGFSAVFERLATIIDDIPTDYFNGKIKDKKELNDCHNKLVDFACKLIRNNHWQILSLDDFERPTAENIMATCKALQKHLKWKKIDLVIIDYLQYIPCKEGKTEYESTNDAVQELKSFVVTEKIPVLALSSLSGEGKLKGSTSIQFTADFCLMVHFLEKSNDRVLSLVKNRRGYQIATKIGYTNNLKIIEKGVL